jgi:hypothetical protein
MSRTKRDPLVISPATQGDVVRFNSLINSLGRVPLFRAIFGAFNFSNIVDFSFLSLIASTSDVDESAVGFISVNDACPGDHSYTSVLSELQSYLPVKVGQIVGAHVFLVRLFEPFY